VEGLCHNSRKRESVMLAKTRRAMSVASDAVSFHLFVDEGVVDGFVIGNHGLDSGDHALAARGGKKIVESAPAPLRAVPVVFTPGGPISTMRSTRKGTSRASCVATAHRVAHAMGDADIEFVHEMKDGASCDLGIAVLEW